jgi:hypothetical protein
MKPESLANSKNIKPCVIIVRIDRSQWMYRIRRDIIEYLRGVEEFIDCTTEDMSQRVIRQFFVLIGISELAKILKYQRSKNSFEYM